MFSLTCVCGLLKKNIIFRWSNRLGLEMFKSFFPISEHSLRNVNFFLQMRQIYMQKYLVSYY